MPPPNSRVTRVLLVLAGLLVPLLPIAAPEAHACSCAVRTHAQIVEETASVFHGTAISREESPRSVTIVVAFDVDRVWKGPAEPRLLVSTGTSGAACGFDFQVGESYTVYAYGSERNLQANNCSPTHGGPPNGLDLSVGPTILVTQPQPPSRAGTDPQQDASDEKDDGSNWRLVLPVVGLAALLLGGSGYFYLRRRRR